VYTEQLTQSLAQLDYIAPVNQGTGTVNTPNPIDMSKNRRCMYQILIGVMGGGATIGLQLQSAAAVGFATPHNMTGGSLALTTTAAGTIATIETTDEAVQNQNPGDRYVRLQVVIGTAACEIAVLGEAGEANHKPAQAQNVAALVPPANQLVVT